METLRIVLACYFAVISAVAVIVTAYDKSAAWKRARRIRESTLLWLGFFGGALAEYLTMLIIRHKTRHTRFMVLLPLFAIIHLALVWYVYIYLK